MHIVRRVKMFVVLGMAGIALCLTAAFGLPQMARAAEDDVCALYYRAPGTHQYTLVIQKGDAPSSKYGKLVKVYRGVVCKEGSSEKNDGSAQQPANCRCGLPESDYKMSVTRVVVADAIAPHQFSFSYFTHLKDIDLALLDTSRMTSMAYMFSGCDDLKKLDLRTFDTSRVTTMKHMFGSCDSLEKIDLSSFDTAKVTNMADMFIGCSRLKSVDVSGFDTAKVTTMSLMFSACDSLEKLDLSRFDMRKVKRMDDMLPSSPSRLAWIKIPATADFRRILPTPDPRWIEGAVGTWQNAAGKTFGSEDIPAFEAGTYKAKRGYSVEHGTLVSPMGKRGQAIRSFAYTGKAIKPDFTVEVAGNTLVKGRDYTISYRNNVKGGSAQVVVKGRGNYSGKLKGSFNIKPPATTLKRAKGAHAAIKVSWKKAASSALKKGQVTGYVVKVTTDKKGKKQVKRVLVKHSKKTSATVKGLKSGKTYYVFVAPYKQLGSDRFEAGWSKPYRVETR